MAYDVRIKNAAELKDELDKHDDKQVIIDFWADWCGPCKALSPILMEIESESEDVVLLKVNVDENQELASALGISSIPTLLFFKDGAANYDPIIGAVPKTILLERLSE